MIKGAGFVRNFGGLWLLFLAGCQTMPLEADFDVPLGGSWRSNQDSEAELVLRSYFEQAESRVALVGSARVLLESADFKLNRPQRIMVERPGRLRFEVVGLFDQVLATLVVDGSRFDFYDGESGQVSRGRVTPSLLWDLAKIDLDVSTLVDVLLAAPTPSPGLARTAFWLESDDQMAFTFARSEPGRSAPCEDSTVGRFFDRDCFVPIEAFEDGGEVFTFDSARRLVELHRFDSEGRLRLHAIFADYQRVVGDDSGFRFPNRITIRSPGIGSEARFSWKWVHFVESLADRSFEIQLREGSTPGD